MPNQPLQPAYSEQSRKKRFLLKDIGPRVRNLNAFVLFLQNELTLNEWMAPSHYKLALNVLRRINFQKPIRDSMQAVVDACRDVSRKFGFDPKKAPVEYFILNIVRVGPLPHHRREGFVSHAIQDLRTIEKLIERYEKDPIIQRHRDLNEKGYDQHSMTLITFYNRCLRAQRGIVKFLATSLDSTALRQAQKEHPDNNRFFNAFRFFTERPYDFGSPWHEELDCNRIDRCHHRMMNVPASEAEGLTAIYELGNKRSFYGKLHQHSPPDAVFAKIESTCKSFRELSRRSSTVAELRRLFRRSAWQAFCALSLPQVEGLFAEMLKLTSLKSEKKALPEKVRLARQFYPYHVHTFDYFEHHLPLLRNKFAHTGIVEQPRETALDLLHDLGFLMHVFEELTIPAMSLRRMMHSPKEHISDVRGVNAFIATIDDVRQEKQLPSVKTELDEFSARYFTNELPLDELTEGIKATTEDYVKAFTDAFKEESSGNVDLAEMKSKEFNQLLPTLANTFESVTRSNELLFTDLADVQFFAERASGEFPFLSSGTRSALAQISGKHKQFWTNLKLLRLQTAKG